jgi:hypothetical protein
MMEDVILISQMVQNGEAKCTRKTLSGIVEKTISEDENAWAKVVSWSFSFFQLLGVYDLL